MIDPKSALRGILRNWGHNILLQRVLDPKKMIYSTKVQRYTVRAVYPGSQRFC